MQSSPRVLVLDDDLATRKVLVRLLESQGCLVETAATTQQAASILANSYYDLLLLDAHLPDGSSHEIIRYVRGEARFRNATVVAVSSDDGAENVRGLIEAGADSFMGKPVTADEVGKILSAYHAARKPEAGG